MYGDQIVQGQQASLSYRPANWLSFSVSRMWWSGMAYSTIGAAVTLKTTSFYANFMPEWGYITGGFRQRFFNRVDLIFNCYVNNRSGRREWNFGIDVPIVK